MPVKLSNNEQFRALGPTSQVCAPIEAKFLSVGGSGLIADKIRP